MYMCVLCFCLVFIIGLAALMDKSMACGLLSRWWAQKNGGVEYSMEQLELFPCEKAHRGFREEAWPVNGLTNRRHFMHQTQWPLGMRW